jgi:flagellar basal-body rod protein FlgC
MSMIGLFNGMNISASGLSAQRVRLNVIASNLANAETTRTEDGGPYQRQRVILKEDKSDPQQRFVFGPDKMRGYTTQSNHIPIPEPGLPIDKDHIGSGVEVASIQPDGAPPRWVHDPDHPDANEQGYVAMPNVNVVEEMTDMISATRAYEANVTALNATKTMIMKALELG